MYVKKTLSITDIILRGNSFYASKFNINYKNFLLIKTFITFYKQNKKEDRNKQIVFSNILKKPNIFSILNFISMTNLLFKETQIVNTSILLLTNIKFFTSIFLKRFQFVFLKRNLLFIYTLRCMYKKKAEMRILIRSTDSNFFVSILSSIPWVSKRNLDRSLSLSKSKVVKPLYVLDTISGGWFGVNKKRRLTRSNFKYSKKIIINMLAKFWLVAHSVENLNVIFESDSNSKFLSYIVKSVRKFLKRIHWGHLNFIRKYRKPIRKLSKQLRFFQLVLDYSSYKLEILYQFYRLYMNRNNLTSNSLNSKYLYTIDELGNGTYNTGMIEVINEADNKELVKVDNETDNKKLIKVENENVNKELVVVDSSLKTLVTQFLPSLYTGSTNNKTSKSSNVYSSRNYVNNNVYNKKIRLKIGKKFASKINIYQLELLNVYIYSVIRLKSLNRFLPHINVIKSCLLIPHNGCKQKKLNVKGRRVSR